MRVLVDTSVWVDFLNGRETPQTETLERCLANRDDLCICGFVLAEVLQGIREEKQFVLTRQRMANFRYLEDDRTTFELGATIYRELRRQGITIRSSIDCQVAAIVLQHGVNFLEHDRDFEFIDRHFPLSRI